MILRLLAVLMLATPLARAQSDPLLVAAGASLSNALREISEQYRPHSPAEQIAYQFGGSGTLQRQIENGAPVDIFVSAAPEHMDALEKEGLLSPGTRTDLLKNTLVLITLRENNAVTGFADLAKPGIKHVAIGDPLTVPAGKYASQVLKSLNLSESVTPKLVRLLDVRQVLAAVVSGNSDAGFVYKTDALISDKIRVAAIASAESHDPIIYPVAVLKRSKRLEDAKKFARFLQTEEAAAIFRKHQFEPVE